MESSRREMCDRACPRYNEDIATPRLKGFGPKPCKIMLIGEAPGQQEDRKGVPFIGRSGQLLIAALAENGVDREEVFITNAVKCATAGGDVAPKQKEITCCRKYLIREISKVQPNVIGVLGNVPLQAILKRNGITKLKNNVYFSEEFNAKVIPVFHPAYVLRNPGVIEDFQKGVSLILKEAGSKKKLSKSEITSRHRDVSSTDDVDKVFQILEKSDHFVFDLETSSLNFLEAEILCIALSWRDGVGVTIPWSVIVKKFWERLKALFKSKKLKINHNLKFDILMLRHQKVAVRGPFFDTLLAASVINENLLEKGLDACTLHYLDIGEYWAPLDKWRDEYLKEHKLKKEDFNYSMFPYPLLSEYAQWDADATHRLFTIFRKSLEDQKLYEYYKKHVIPTMKLLIEMEYHGVRIDRENLLKLIEEYNIKLETEKQAIFELAEVKEYEKIRKKKVEAEFKEKHKKSTNIQSRFPNVKEYLAKYIKEDDWRFNPQSPMQLQDILFDICGETPISYSEKTKRPSTDEATLIALAEKGNKLSETILKHRKLAKYISTYLQATYDKSRLDGRVHANYLQHKTVTGRLSCTNPNMQNIGRDAKDYKSCILADPGYCFVKGDLKQAEFRCWAHYSEDPAMIADIAAGLDIHRRTAAQVFEKREEEVTDEERTIAKTIVFGAMYGRGARAIAKAFGISQEQAEEVKRLFFSKYPRAEQWLQEQIANAEEYGYVKTWLGRLRRLPNIHSDMPEVKAAAEREATNSPIQGLASNMNDHYMVESLKLAQSRGIDCFPAITQHDAQIFEVRKEQMAEMIEVMKYVVDHAFPDFLCKMVLDFEVGPTLGTLEKVK